jgi:hypothetical protein
MELTHVLTHPAPEYTVSMYTIYKCKSSSVSAKLLEKSE